MRMCAQRRTQIRGSPLHGSPNLMSRSHPHGLRPHLPASRSRTRATRHRHSSIEPAPAPRRRRARHRTPRTPLPHQTTPESCGKRVPSIGSHVLSRQPPKQRGRDLRATPARRGTRPTSPNGPAPEGHRVRCAGQTQARVCEGTHLLRIWIAYVHLSQIRCEAPGGAARPLAATGARSFQRGGVATQRTS